MLWGLTAERLPLRARSGARLSARFVLRHELRHDCESSMRHMICKFLGTHVVRDMSSSSFSSQSEAAPHHV